MIGLTLALTLAACGGSSEDAPSDPNTVVMRDIAFSPGDLTVKTGQTVTWVNEDSVEHNVVSESDPKLKSQLFGKDGKFEFRTTKAGTFPYVCTVHPGMEGTLTVQ